MYTKVTLIDKAKTDEKRWCAVKLCLFKDNQIVMCGIIS